MAGMVATLLDPSVAGTFTEAVMHTPRAVTDKAVLYTRKQQADCIVSIGGGSTVGLGKAISLTLHLPHVCIPTTYAGSAMTPILGQTENGIKTTMRSVEILPKTVIYDVQFTMTLPIKQTVTSGLNAIAHAGKSGD